IVLGHNQIFVMNADGSEQHRITDVSSVAFNGFPDWGSAITTTYSPSGRGVRSALWVVGLGAIAGLGIGLLVVRREASRIADRSGELVHLSAELRPAHPPGR